jgi:ferredoxin-NADP reductase
MTELYTLKNKIQESPLTVTFQFVPEKTPMEFYPGQYIKIHVKDEEGNLSEKGMPFSISSSPLDDHLSVTVKKAGPSSIKMHDLGINDVVGISGPSGRFTAKDTLGHIVYLAGGIGIVPFRSMIRSASTLYPQTEFTLFYSEHFEKDLIFTEEFENLKNVRQKLSTIVCVTGEHPEKLGYENRRIDSDLLKNKIESFSDKHFFLCGSFGFVQAMKNLLIDEEVKDEFIHVEIF